MLILLLLLQSAFGAFVAVDFHHALNEGFVKEFEDVVGKRVKTVVPPATIKMQLSPEQQADLVAHFGDTIGAIRTIDARDRVSPMLQQMSAPVKLQSKRSVGLPVMALNGTMFARPATDVPQSLTILANLVDDSNASEIEAYALLEPFDVDVTVEINDGVMLIRNVPNDAEVVNRLVDLLLDPTDTPVEWVQQHYAPRLQNFVASSHIQRLGHISETSLTSALQARSTLSEHYPLWASGIRGEGQVIGISDTGLMVDSCFFADSEAVPYTNSKTVPSDTGHSKIRAYWCHEDCTDENRHGTHVCGTAAGKALTQHGVGDSSIDSADFDGVAPNARLAFIDIQTGSGGLFPPYPYSTQMFAFIVAAGGAIHSGSWGSDDPSYGAEEIDIDLFCWNNPHFVNIMAAGNDGEDGAATILSPGLSKNTFTVGAGMNGVIAFELATTQQYANSAYGTDAVAAFSSQGGAAMLVNWVKPDILAGGGEYQWSASGGDEGVCANVNAAIDGRAGTSSGTPTVAGAVALIRQYFMEGSYGFSFEPTSALVFCILIASAQPMATLFPNVNITEFAAGASYAPYKDMFVQGFGRVSLTDALEVPAVPTTKLFVLANGEADSKVMETNDIRRYCVSIDGSGVADASVVLAWTDYPSAAGGTASIVNDLDLYVHVNGGSRQPINGLPSGDTRSTRERATMVGITLPAELTIEVRGGFIGFLSQPYSLVVRASGADVTLPTHVLPATIGFDTTGGTCTEITHAPTPLPTSTNPTPVPTVEPTAAPTIAPTPLPTAMPTPLPTAIPTAMPTPLPTAFTTDVCGRYGVQHESTCVCLLGTTGPDCMQCASAPAPTVYLCVGLDQAFIPHHLAHYGNHTLVSVTSSTLGARLNGSYYDDVIVKEPDSLPGEGQLSCLCVPYNTAAISETATLLHDRETIIALALPSPQSGIASITLPPTPSPTAAHSGGEPRAFPNYPIALALGAYLIVS